jgi:AAA family ATP:ADP antiporter
MGAGGRLRRAGLSTLARFRRSAILQLGSTAETGARGLTTTMQLSRLERFLRLFTEVRSGEGVTAVLMFVNVFLLLCAYYFVKPLREAWLSVTDVMGLEPKELKAYSAFAQSLVLLPVIAWYGTLSDRMHRSTLITRATLFCMSNLVIFFIWRPGGPFDAIPGAGLAFYIWVSIFGLFVVAQFWAFAADIYTDERGRRLMPMIAIGATGGAAFGSSVVTPMVKGAEFGADVLLLAALVPLAFSIALTRVVDAKEGGGATPAPPAEPEAPRAEKPRGGFAMIATSRFLMAAAAITLLLNWVNTNGENLLFSVIVEFLKEEVAEKGLTDPAAVESFTKDGVAAFYGNFFTWVNAAALILQALVASRLLKYGGFGVILLMLPVISLLSYATMALVPVLIVIKMMKVAENSTDYSINNTARSVLWLPTTSDMKFKCKPAIDTIFVRMGDGFSAATVWFGTNVIALSNQGYFAFNVALVLIWLAASIVLVREHRKITEANASAGVG